MIAKHIKELLFEQDCVVIPDFGGFIANYVSADIHPIRHTFAPPSKCIAFNEMLRLNDGLLANHVAHSEHISRDEALSKIQDFTRQLREELNQKQKYRLAEIGTLFLSHEKKVQFEPENRINYLNDSFGLPELLYKPIERNASARNSSWNAGNFMKVKTKDRSAMPNEETYRKEEEEPYAGESASYAPSRMWMFLGVPLVLLLATTTGLFLFFDDGNTVLSSFNPFTALYSTRKTDSQPVNATNQHAAEPVAKAPAESLPVEKEGTVAEPTAASTTPDATAAPTTEEVKPAIDEATPETAAEPTKMEHAAEYVAIATDVPRYYVIVGSFSKHRNALKLRKRLVAKGITDSKLIVPKVEANLHKVTYADYATFEEAAAKMEELKGEYGSEVWVFKYVK